VSEDIFFDVLRFVNPQSVISRGFKAGGPWALQFPVPDKIKFCGVVKGECWLLIDGEVAPVHIEPGDVFLVSAQRPFVLASDLAVTPVGTRSVFTADAGPIVTLGNGEEFFLIGGHVRLEANGWILLSDVLPGLIHVRAATAEATTLQWLLDQLVHERGWELPGAGLASSYLARLIFVQMLRAHLNTPGSPRAGWMRGVSDKRLNRALQLMHSDPGRAWQLKELASACAMSRTSFALHFKTITGIAPLTYLTEWRMRLAEQALRDQDTSVSVLAQSLGYTSESAFSKAFKRVSGTAPKRYRSANRSRAQKIASPWLPSEGSTTYSR
jgi:AraC-like DNA-binding protein